MRKDMYKVIVERPRLGRHAVKPSRRIEDLEESPRQQGLSKYHRSKGLNENLNPLERFLHAQVGRPWSKVYAEICAGIDRRNTVQQHIHQHLQDFVAVRVIRIGDEPHAQHRWGQPRPLADRWAPRLFVDPDTGLLCANRLRERAIRRNAQVASRKRQQDEGRRVVLDATRQLHRLDGLWFEVELAPLSRAETLQRVPFDVLRHVDPAKCPSWNDSKGLASNQSLFGRHDVYAWRKRQLPSVELKHYRLSNDAGDSTPDRATRNHHE